MRQSRVSDVITETEDYRMADPGYPLRASAASNRSVRRIIFQSYS